ncbi:hypothetical protein E2C01_037336 [Portunus trituberculatus]|uniref:Uncharacterized protein n=1 Tax=Portunus trituberculatus TaxID=210409 RepID=A0A5B7FDW8_PORTR|nr:hypothetical protein [Portunus trituberculatus]
MQQFTARATQLKGQYSRGRLRSVSAALASRFLFRLICACFSNLPSENSERRGGRQTYSNMPIHVPFTSQVSHRRGDGLQWGVGMAMYLGSLAKKAGADPSGATAETHMGVPERTTHRT